MDCAMRMFAYKIAISSRQHFMLHIGVRYITQMYNVYVRDAPTIVSICKTGLTSKTSKTMKHDAEAYYIVMLAQIIKLFT